MSEAIISINKLSKTYVEGFLNKKVPALQNLSLDVPKGLIFGFLGANGAGKTTTIKILMGLQFASSGSAKILGHACGSDEAKACIGYLPERPYFHDNLTANEFLNFHRFLYGNSTTITKQSNSELLELVGIPGTENKLLRSFSKGMLQRVGIAQTLINNPSLIILDEPMSGLDPLGRRDIRNLILHLASEGKTIFFSTHILSDVESLCEEIAFLEKGVLKYNGSIKTLLASSVSEFELIFDRLSMEQVQQEPLLGEAKKIGSSAWKLNLLGEEKSRATMELIWQRGGNIVNYGRAQKSLEEALFGLKKEV